MAARLHALSERNERVRETATLLRWLFEKVISETERGFSANTWKPGELGRQGVDCRHPRMEA